MMILCYNIVSSYFYFRRDTILWNISKYTKTLKKDIRKKYKQWGNLESENTLTEKYQVSRMTLRQAINKLKTEGFVHSRQGGGIYINPPEFYTNKSLQSLSEKEENVSSKIISFQKL